MVAEYNVKRADIDESTTIDKYKEKMKGLLTLYYPHLKPDVFNDAIEYSIHKRYKSENADMYNNYTNKLHHADILTFCDYIERRQPIVTSWGTLYKRHEEEPNPLGMVIQKFLDARKIHKDEMFKYPKGSENYEKYNLFQQLDKVDTNAIYGLLGAPTSIVFNINISPSITRMGQSLVSSALS